MRYACADEGIAPDMIAVAKGIAGGYLPMGGIVDGKSGDHVMLAPPFIINSSHVAEIMDKLGRTVHSVLKEVLVKAA